MSDEELIAQLRSMLWCVMMLDNGVGVSNRTVAADAADRIEELEAKLAVVEKERDDLRSLVEAETREGENSFRNQIDRYWEINRIINAMGVIRTEGAIAKIEGEQP